MHEYPFVGLRPFDAEDALLFFGRRKQALELIEKIHHNRFVGIVGSSGCGKSSLVRAGLLPKLKAGMLIADRDKWALAVMKPGDSPRLNLAAALLDAVGQPGEDDEIKTFENDIKRIGLKVILEKLENFTEINKTNILLLVDQFEEIFRWTESNLKKYSEAADFVYLILSLANQETIPIYVVMTMRSDYIGDCDRFANLPEALNRSQYLVPRLKRDQLREIIEGPLSLFGSDIDDRLIDKIINDTGNKPDHLPLLQHALMQMWKDSKGTEQREIYYEHYEKAGTVQNALNKHAEAIYEKMSTNDQGLTESIFKCLTTIDKNKRFIRRRVTIGTLADITGKSATNIIRIVRTFSQEGRSFLVEHPSKFEHDILIDISHEALIRRWTRLREWTKIEVNDSKVMTDVINRSLEHEKKESRLLGFIKIRKSRLLGFIKIKNIRKIKKKHTPFKSWLSWVRLYHNINGQALNKVNLFIRKSQYRLAAIGIFFALIPIGLSIGIGIYHSQKEKHDETFDSMYLSQLADKQMAKTNIPPEEKIKAAIFTLEAYERSKKTRYPKVEVYSVQQLHRIARALDFFLVTTNSYDHNKIRTFAINKTKKIIATSHDSGKLQLWDLSQRNIKPIQIDNRSDEVITCLSFSKDGTILAGGTQRNAVIKWDLKDFKKKPINRSIKYHHNFAVTAIALDTETELLASGDDRGNIILWDIHNDLTVKSEQKLYEEEVTSIIFAPSNKFLAAGSGQGDIILWDLHTKVYKIHEGNRKSSGDLAVNPASIPKNRINALTFNEKGSFLAFEGSNHIGIYEIDENLSSKNLKLFGRPGNKIPSLYYSSENGGRLESISHILHPEEPIKNDNQDIPSSPTGFPWNVGDVSHTAMDPDGRYYAILFKDGKLRWRMPIKEMVSEICSRSKKGMTKDEFRELAGDEPSKICEGMYGIDQEVKERKKNAKDKFDDAITIFNQPDVPVNEFEKALYYFQEAENKDPNLVPVILEYKQKLADSYIEGGRSQFDIQNALKLFDYAVKLDPEIEPEAQKAKASKYIEYAILIVKRSDISKQDVEQSKEYFDESRRLGQEIPIDSLNEICTFGSLHQYPSIVLNFCEQAVQKDPDSYRSLSSRATAYAILSEKHPLYLTKAIEDFDTSIKFAEHQLGNGSIQREFIKSLEEWRDSLKKDRQIPPGEPDATLHRLIRPPQ